MASPEKVKRRNLYPEQRSREQAAAQRARQLMRHDLPSRMNSPEKVRRCSRYLRNEAESKPPSNALGTNWLLRRVSPAAGGFVRAVAASLRVGGRRTPGA